MAFAVSVAYIITAYTLEYWR